MFGAALGRRYERLLFFTAPLSLAAFLVLFVAVAYDNQAESSLARCYEATANAIDANRDSLTQIWDSDQDHSPTSLAPRYKPEVIRTLVSGSLNASCFSKMLDEFDERYRIFAARK